MFKVYFGNYNERKLLKSFDSFKEAQEYVYKLINGEYGDISYYIRIWENEEWTTYDYGSHHTFFYIKRG